jgi:hypothetical protein
MTRRSTTVPNFRTLARPTELPPLSTPAPLSLARPKPGELVSPQIDVSLFDDVSGDAAPTWRERLFRVALAAGFCFLQGAWLWVLMITVLWMAGVV